MGKGRAFWLHSWWMVAFVLLAMACYFQALHSRNVVFSDLALQLNQMEQTKNAVARERDDLQRRLQSESDPAWMEMVLMKELGVVPEGWTKVYFKKE